MGTSSKQSAASSQGMLGTTGVSSMGGFTQEVDNISSAGILKMAAGGRDTPGRVSKTDHVPSSGQRRGNIVLYLAHPEGLSSSLAAPGVAKASFAVILAGAGDRASAPLVIHINSSSETTNDSKIWLAAHPYWLDLTMEHLILAFTWALGTKLTLYSEVKPPAKQQTACAELKSHWRRYPT